MVHFHFYNVDLMTGFFFK